MPVLFALAAGLVFGVGLIVSGLYNPAKVIAFLDLAGKWDPSLPFVMLTAIPIYAVAYRYIKGHKRTLLGGALHLPAAKDIDLKLVGGAAVFGIGWGLAGICPGPAMVVLGTGREKGFVFLVALLAGMGFYEWIERTLARRAAARERARLHPPVRHHHHHGKKHA